jgi:hypothetical protein
MMFEAVQIVSMPWHIAEYFVQAWDVRNTCKHPGAVPIFFRWR